MFYINNTTFQFNGCWPLSSEVNHDGSRSATFISRDVNEWSNTAACVQWRLTVATDNAGAASLGVNVAPDRKTGDDDKSSRHGPSGEVVKRCTFVTVVQRVVTSYWSRRLLYHCDSYSPPVVRGRCDHFC